MRTAVTLAMLALVVPAAHADYRIVGHGFGHGVGLAQYGAMGYARNTSHTWRWIVRHYYPGTGRRTVAAGTRLRVRIKTTSAARVSGATLARGAQGRRLPLRSARTYRFVPWTADGVRAIDLASGRTLAYMHGPVRLSGSVPLRVLGLGDNGVRDGRYRGDVVLAREAERVLVIDDVGIESYLFGVVPAEMPSSWPAEALRSQAVVARSYALTSLRPTQAFDVYSDTRSQAYRGVAGETARTTAAVRDTRGVVVTYAGAIARTLFASSSGGRTAAIEEVFGGPPVPYLVSVDDPYDTLSPYHDWTARLTDADAAKRLAAVVQGDLVDIAVGGTTPSGRAAIVRVTGTLGVTDIPATTARTRLGLRSTWFRIDHEPTPARRR
jgi:stage II sporulation protein D